MGATAPLHFHVALLGFSRFERQTLAAYLKRSEEHSPAYELVDDIVDADMLVADADHLGALDQVQALARTRDAVFIGSSAPDGALGWMMRPLDPMQVLRVLDSSRNVQLQAAQLASGQPAAPRQRRFAPQPSALQPTRRVSDGAAPQRRQRRAEALVVHRDDGALRELSRRLSALGWTVRDASGSQAALAAIATAPPAFVLIDGALDDAALDDRGLEEVSRSVDALSLCRQIKQRRDPRAPAPAVVLVAAAAQAADRVRATLAGADACIDHALDAETLHGVLAGLGADQPATVSGFGALR